MHRYASRQTSIYPRGATRLTQSVAQTQLDASHLHPRHPRPQPPIQPTRLRLPVATPPTAAPSDSSVARRSACPPSDQTPSAYLCIRRGRRPVPRPRCGSAMSITQAGLRVPWARAILGPYEGVVKWTSSRHPLFWFVCSPGIMDVWDMPNFHSRADPSRLLPEPRS